MEPTSQYAPSPAPSVETTSEPTLDPDCVNSPSWFKKDDPSKHCDWVDELPDPRCSVKGQDGGLAENSCRASCGCPPLPSSEPTTVYAPSPAPTVVRTSEPTTQYAPTASPTVTQTEPPTTIYAPSPAPTVKTTSEPTLYAPSLAPTPAPTSQYKPSLAPAPVPGGLTSRPTRDPTSRPAGVLPGETAEPTREPTAVTTAPTLYEKRKKKDDDDDGMSETAVGATVAAVVVIFFVMLCCLYWYLVGCGNGGRGPRQPFSPESWDPVVVDERGGIDYSTGYEAEMTTQTPLRRAMTP